MDSKRFSEMEAAALIGAPVGKTHIGKLAAPVGSIVAEATTKATQAARLESAMAGNIMAKGRLTTHQKNEIIAAIDGVLQNQGDEGEQVQIATLLTVVAVRRLLEARYKNGVSRGARVKMARELANHFENSLRRLIKESD